MSSGAKSTGECIENFRCSEAFRDKYRSKASETDKSRSEYIRAALDFYEPFATLPDEKIQEIKSFAVRFL